MPGPRLRRLSLAGLLAIAASSALVAIASKYPPETEPDLISVTSSSRGLGFRALLDRRHQLQPLAVPPPVLPQPLPPQQAWPELPARVKPNFTDLNSDYWAWPLLADLAQRDLVTGFPDGAFRPDDPMTRAEFAVQLARLFNLSFDQSQAPKTIAYSDIPPDHWAYSSIRQSVQMGFLDGDADNAFLPDQPVSRIGVIVALANGLMLKSSSSPAAVLKVYSDQTQVPPWAIRPLIAATEAGLVVNHPDTSRLAPNQPASRAEVLAMLHQALVYIGTLKDVPFPYSIDPALARP